MPYTKDFPLVRERMQTISTPNVEFCGQVSDDALGAYYRVTDLFLCMSEHGWRVCSSKISVERTEQLARQICQQSQPAQIKLLGNISERDKADLLAACDVFALDSGDESSGIVALPS